MTTEDDEPRLADRFRARRKEMGKTQQEAADAAGVSLRTVQSFELGNSTPQRANLRALLRWARLDDAVPAGTEFTERAWPPDISVFLDVMGAYLSRFEPEERLKIIHSVTRQIFLSHQET